MWSATVKEVVIRIFLFNTVRLLLTILSVVIANIVVISYFGTVTWAPFRRHHQRRHQLTLHLVHRELQ